MEYTLAQKVLMEISPGQVASTTALHRILIYKDHYKKKIKRSKVVCNNFQGPDKTKCLLTYKIKTTEELVANMKKAQLKCEDDKCKEKIEKKIDSQLLKIDTLKQNLDNVIQQSYRKR